jgi:hypothetical protein
VLPLIPDHLQMHRASVGAVAAQALRVAVVNPRRTPAGTESRQ